jgi:hypothetical protein
VAKEFVMADIGRKIAPSKPTADKKRK